MKNTTLTFLLCLFCIVATYSWAKQSGPPQSGGTLIFARGSDSSTLDPRQANDGESLKVIPSLFEKLVDFEDHSTIIKPGLAEAWTTDQENKRWTFHLKKNVTFHDGTNFNADAVIFSIKRQIDPEHPNYEKDLPYAKLIFKYLLDIEKKDDHTVVFILDKPYGPFINNIAHPAASIVSPTAVKKYGPDFHHNPVGTGPFRFFQWTESDGIILTRNPDYHGKTPLLDRVIFKSIKNTQDRLTAIKSSSIHAMDGIDRLSASIIRKEGDIELEISPGINMGYLAMNTEKIPFNNPSVRKAIYHAINKEKIVKLFFQDLAIPAKNPIPPTIMGYNDTIIDYPYDPEFSRKLLKQEGYKNGFETTLWSMPIARPYMPRPDKIAMAIKANLEAVGIRIKIKSSNWPSYLHSLYSGEHDMGLLGWTSDNGDPDNFLYTLLHSDNTIKPIAKNISFFKSEYLDTVLIKAQQETDTAKRKILYKRAQEIIHTHVPIVPLVHSKQLLAFRKNIHGIVQQPTEDVRFNNAWIEQ